MGAEEGGGQGLCTGTLLRPSFLIQCARAAVTGTCRNLSTKNRVCELPFCGRWPTLAVPSGRLEGSGVVGGAAQGCGSSLASVVNGGSALPPLFRTDSVRIKPLISEDFQMQTVPMNS